jgi:peptidoglycan/xylan/chitin deacetylase (PgdA/CDA1 family)
VFLLAMGLHLLTALTSVAAAPMQPAVPPRVITRVPVAEKKIAFTFDDGPNVLYTPQFISLLRKYDAHATFFLLGLQAQENPEIILRLRAAGMEVGNHGMRHRYLRADNPHAASEEARDGEQAIMKAGVPRPTLYRLPGGIGGPRVRLAVSSLGYRLVGWSVDPRDSMNASTAQIVAAVEQGVTPGAIVLMHDGPPNRERERTLAALRQLLPELKSQGYQICSVGELLKSSRTAS